MLQVVRDGGILKRVFAGLTEQAFQVRLGVADSQLIDYVSEMLMRFVRTESIFGACPDGNRWDSVTDMLGAIGEQPPETRRPLLRHVGDFTLFWTGVYPEALARLQSKTNPDHLLDYPEQGKRSYFLASCLDDNQGIADNRLLRRLSDEFDACVAGLRHVRYEWERWATQSQDVERN